MEFNQENTRFFLNNEQGDMIAEVTFTRAGEQLFIIDHTFVDESLRGQGVGEKLVAAVVELARSEGKKIMPLCPFAKKEFERKSQYADVLK